MDVTNCDNLHPNYVQWRNLVQPLLKLRARWRTYLNLILYMLSEYVPTSVHISKLVFILRHAVLYRWHQCPGSHNKRPEEGTTDMSPYLKEPRSWTGACTATVGGTLSQAASKTQRLCPACQDHTSPRGTEDMWKYKTQLFYRLRWHHSQRC